VQGLGLLQTVQAPNCNSNMASILDNDVLVKASGYRVKYHPYGVQAEIFGCKDDEILLAGPKGSGKSLSALHKLHLVLSKYNNSKGFMSRKTRTSMTNSCLDMFQRHVLKPMDKVHFHKQDQQFNYPSGSVLAVIGLDNVDRLNSSEWDIGYCQEATEATEKDWEIMTACIRNGVVPYQQLMGDCNPDKPTHWLKVRCDKDNPDNPGKKMCTMFKSVHQDNPKFFDHSRNVWTPEGERYIAKLRRLSGVRFKRLFLGEWAAAEGLVYDLFDHSTHIINRSELPIDWVDWPHYWALDWGFTHPVVWQDWMEDPKGRLYLNREIYRTKYMVEDLAREVISINEGLPLPRAIICDHDPGDRATFERHSGLLTLPAYKDIRIGVQAVQKRLQRDWDGLPGLMLLSDALLGEDAELKDEGKPYSTAQEFDGYVWDEKVNKLVNSKKDEIPMDKDNHGMDALRYAVAFIDDLSEDPQDIEGLVYYGEEEIISPF
jgi:PBSX family phage terminase large subunit